ncbi:DUF1800 domain-containing protein [Ramlibacter sp. XY19]|uniref:DUF1800 domain-containing protein n=1 Tax=Ramlibacter paludis TaxID=2908000 RepID=UPI0023DAD1F0|nr:DUF1800 domain-containing protein [Ramlibacter paludis]MCG2591416.1 DUF1800 domain-containing protein [Ramlibacter paludis]
MSPAADPRLAAAALNRFGLGARPGETLPPDPRAFLLAQFERYDAKAPAWSGEPGSGELVTYYGEYQRGLRGPDELAARQKLAQLGQERYRSAVLARTASAVETQAPFAERLVHFWANHFAVSVEKAPLGLLAGSFEAEAIRPHVFGRFEDLLLAAERHPAMLLYLDQARSVGPESAAGRRAPPERRRGLNENLAREILELHTLGVRSGYGQDDVTEFARALTGWSVGGLPGLPANAAPGAFAYFPALHEPGPRRVLGQAYDQRGEAQAAAILSDLARHPATAQHIAAKLARHFAGDQPPPVLQQRLAEAFLQSGGDLPTVYRALVESPEAWAQAQPKFKTPWDWTLSALRGLGVREPRSTMLAPMLAQLGQPVWRPGSPAGYDDLAASWMAPDLLLRRVELAQRLASLAPATLDARALAPQLLPGGVGAATATALARADSPATALALLMVSPEFMRR